MKAPGVGLIPPAGLLKDLQVEGRLEQAVQVADAFEGPLERRGLARFHGDDEGQRVLGIAGLLHDGANVDALAGQRSGDLGDDAGPVVDQEADVVGNLELRGSHSLGRMEFRLAAIRCARASRSLTTATAVGCPPAPWPEKTTSPP